MAERRLWLLSNDLSEEQLVEEEETQKVVPKLNPVAL